jgi:hypothetical protein
MLVPCREASGSHARGLKRSHTSLPQTFFANDPADGEDSYLEMEPTKVTEIPEDAYLEMA